MKLFAPVSIINNFMGFDNVLFRWLVVHRPIPLPYHLIIENYIPRPPEGEDDIHFFVDELFTEDELKQFTDISSRVVVLSCILRSYHCLSRISHTYGIRVAHWVVK